jgi:glycosyltransferase involved in cell wall biosynthesis
VAPDDPIALADAMEAMIDLPPEQHRAIAAAARAKAEADFSLLHEVSTIAAWMADETREVHHEANGPHNLSEEPV